MEKKRKKTKQNKGHLWGCSRLFSSLLSLPTLLVLFEMISPPGLAKYFFGSLSLCFFLNVCVSHLHTFRLGILGLGLHSMSFFFIVCLFFFHGVSLKTSMAGPHFPPLAIVVQHIKCQAYIHTLMSFLYM